MESKGLIVISTKSNVKKTNPIQSQTNPIGSDAQNERNYCLHNRLQRKTAFQPPRKQTQFKPNSKQNKPNLLDT